MVVSTRRETPSGKLRRALLLDTLLELTLSAAFSSISELSMGQHKEGASELAMVVCWIIDRQGHGVAATDADRENRKASQ